MPLPHPVCRTEPHTGVAPAVVGYIRGQRRLYSAVFFSRVRAWPRAYSNGGRTSRGHAVLSRAAHGLAGETRARRLCLRCGDPAGIPGPRDHGGYAGGSAQAYAARRRHWRGFNSGVRIPVRLLCKIRLPGILLSGYARAARMRYANGRRARTAYAAGCSGPDPACL